VLAADTLAEGHGSTRPSHRCTAVNVQMIGDAKGNRFVPASIISRGHVVTSLANVHRAHNRRLLSGQHPGWDADRPAGNVRANGPAHAFPLFAAPNATTPSSFAGSIRCLRVLLLATFALGMRAQVVVHPYSGKGGGSRRPRAHPSPRRRARSGWRPGPAASLSALVVLSYRPTGVVISAAAGGCP